MYKKGFMSEEEYLKNRNDCIKLIEEGKELLAKDKNEELEQAIKDMEKCIEDLDRNWKAICFFKFLDDAFKDNKDMED